MIAAKDLIEKLSSFFVTRDDIAFAFLFGSWAKERPNPNSDIDVAVYFYSENHELEVEDDVFFDEEDAVWADVDRISGVETDLLVL
ncbi:MAG: nucleotidyltransferase domain-containing protein, partial [Spirochaetales bacterium]|nr:nucleotidyltransferase domain-containing protein [Spirochaetales bacterium]